MDSHSIWKDWCQCVLCERGFLDNDGFHIMLSPIADASRASTQSNYPEDSTGPRAKSAIYDCPVNTSVNYTDAACAANQDLRNGRLSVRPSVCLNHCPLCCNEGNQGMSLERGKE